MTERAAKLAVLVSMGTALALEATLAAPGWGRLPLLTAVVFLAAVCAGTLAETAAVSVVLAFAYVFPAAIQAGHGRYFVDFGVLWTAALLGAIAPRAAHSGWSVPGRWRGALILWALTVSLAWPVVALREIDWLPSVLNQGHLASSIAGGTPRGAVTWTLQVATILGVGILWFDWLFAVFAGDAPSFRRFVLLPLAASACVASAVGVYQSLGDPRFMNGGVFAGIGRASGTMLDANAFGAVEALVSGGILAWWLGEERSYRWLALSLLMLSWIGLWGSGSRTALVAGVVPLVALAWRLARPASPGAQRLRRRELIVAATAAVAFVAVVTTVDLPTVGAVRRLRASLPTASARSVEAFLREMWRRNGYGSAAAAMTSEHPLVGIGVGSFHVMVPDYAGAAGLGRLPPDNAQNWFRHQLVEFGLLGSLGWIAWVGLFGVFLWRAPIPARDRLPADMLRAALVGLALISLVGMPSQNVSVAFTFWTMAFWFTLTTEGPPSNAAAPVVSRRAWMAIAVVLSLFVAGTAYAARHELRPARRALAHRWPYSYGFSVPELAPDGLMYRWAGKRAVAAIPASRPWMRVIASVNHLDIATNPVHAKIWCADRLVVDTTLRTTAPVTAYVHMPDGQPGVVLETWVSRVLRPRDFGVADDRDLGLRVHWDFIDVPPPGAPTSDVTPR